MILYQGLPILTHCYREFVILCQHCVRPSDSRSERRDARRAVGPRRPGDDRGPVPNSQDIARNRRLVEAKSAGEIHHIIENETQRCKFMIGDDFLHDGHVK